MEAPAPAVAARLRRAQHLVELRAPVTVSRDAVDDVERGARDCDREPVGHTAGAMAFAADGAVFDGCAAAGTDGLRRHTSHRVSALPGGPRTHEAAVALSAWANAQGGEGGGVPAPSSVCGAVCGGVQ
ncbi:encapsulin [Streptomyces broussonetiae]|uniref:encapsulin n=1 Tax=Streptomyces broussonetiae TaxID=2686304 RepID=UPI001E604046|nr:family 1 encapsulin nanocompartment shell protein [Streptomyces broussonetiae]